MTSICMKAPRAIGLKKPRPLHKALQIEQPTDSIIKFTEEYNNIDNRYIKKEANSNVKLIKNDQNYYTATLEYTGDILVVASASIQTLMQVTTIISHNIDANVLKIETSDLSKETDDCSPDQTTSSDKATVPGKTTAPDKTISPDKTTSLDQATGIDSDEAKRYRYTSVELVSLAKNILAKNQPENWAQIKSMLPDIVNENPEYFRAVDYSPLNSDIFRDAPRRYQCQNSGNNNSCFSHVGNNGGFSRFAAQSTVDLREPLDIKKVNCEIGSNGHHSSDNNNSCFSRLDVESTVELTEPLNIKREVTSKIEINGRRPSGNNNSCFSRLDVESTVELTEPLRPDVSSEMRDNGRRPSGNNNTCFSRLDVESTVELTEPLRPNVSSEMRDNGRHFSSNDNDNTGPEDKLSVKWQHDHFRPDETPRKYVQQTNECLHQPNFYGGEFIHRKNKSYLKSSISQASPWLPPNMSEYGLINDPLRAVNVNSFL